MPWEYLTSILTLASHHHNEIQIRAPSNAISYPEWENTTRASHHRTWVSVTNHIMVHNELEILSVSPSCFSGNFTEHIGANLNYLSENSETLRHWEAMRHLSLRHQDRDRPCPGTETLTLNFRTKCYSLPLCGWSSWLEEVEWACWTMTKRHSSHEATADAAVGILMQKTCDLHLPRDPSL